MAMSTGRSDSGPMMEINTTPLIDVMLVLLIMIIMTLPIQSHAVKVDLPQNNPNQKPPVVLPVKNDLGIAANGAILWNGVPISELQLRQYLAASVQISPEPELHFQPDPNARYETVDEVLADIKRANVTKLGFVGNENYRTEF